MFGCCTKSCEELPVVLTNVRFAQTSYELSNVVRSRTGFLLERRRVLAERFLCRGDGVLCQGGGVPCGRGRLLCWVQLRFLLERTVFVMGQRRVC